jgi:hypothetical protein
LNERSGQSTAAKFSLANPFAKDLCDEIFAAGAKLDGIKASVNTR